jgi:spore germination protein GerM
MELLKGPTANEISRFGISTAINPDVEIQSLTIVDGVAQIDFSESLDYQVGGSCRVTAIRSQITNTLLEFPTVDEVVISINGRIDDILQP